jgi:hypothetical protein
MVSSGCETSSRCRLREEQVLVSADAQLIESTVTSMGKVVQQRELEELPLNAAISRSSGCSARCRSSDAWDRRSGRPGARRPRLRGEWPAVRIKQLSHRRCQQFQRRRRWIRVEAPGGRNQRVPHPHILGLAALGTLILALAGSGWTALVGAAILGAGLGSEADVLPYLLARYFGRRHFSALYGLTWTA